MAFEYDERRVHCVDHPIARDMLGRLRAKDTESPVFRALVNKLATIEGLAATKNDPVRDVTVDTPVDVAQCAELACTYALVPILRAGLAMLDGMLEILPEAKVGVLGMYRDEQTHEPHSYYAKMPPDIADRRVLVIDPMLATGGSAAAAISYLRDKGCKDVTLLVLVAAPEGLSRVLSEDADIEIYTCAIDSHLNEDAYIVPGLGDAGDRVFGTL